MIKYDDRLMVGDVDVEVDHFLSCLSQYNKLRVLSTTMNNWEKNNGQVPIDSRMGRMFESDLSKVMGLMKDGLNTKGKNYLTKEEMIEMNKFFKRYDGKRG